MAPELSLISGWTWQITRGTHATKPDLIPRSRVSGVSKDESPGATWFETALARLLTMRI
jgi:hypothetical protein